MTHRSHHGNQGHAGDQRAHTHRLTRAQLPNICSAPKPSVSTHAGAGCSGGPLSDFESVDFFTNASLIPDLYPYFEHLRDRCPVLQQSGVVAVTGHPEALAVYKDPAFSSCVSVAGPFSGLPFEPGGDSAFGDIGALIEQHRAQIPMSEHIVTQDPPEHTRTRGLLSRLLTPKRLKENEDFMWTC
jgi:cytochrome P450